MCNDNDLEGRANPAWGATALGNAGSFMMGWRGSAMREVTMTPKKERPPTKKLRLFKLMLIQPFYHYSHQITRDYRDSDIFFKGIIAVNGVTTVFYRDIYLFIIYLCYI